MWKGVCKFEERLGPEVVLIAALARRSDGGYAVIGMRDIANGKFYAEQTLEDGEGGKQMREVTQLEATGGEMFAMNYSSVEETFKALREILEQNKQET